MSEVLTNPDSFNKITKEAFDFEDKDSNDYIDMNEFELCNKNISEFFSLEPSKI